MIYIIGFTPLVDLRTTEGAVPSADTWRTQMLAEFITSHSALSPAGFAFAALVLDRLRLLDHENGRHTKVDFQRIVFRVTDRNEESRIARALFFEALGRQQRENEQHPQSVSHPGRPELSIRRSIL